MVRGILRRHHQGHAILLHQRILHHLDLLAHWCRHRHHLLVGEIWHLHHHQHKLLGRMVHMQWYLLFHFHHFQIGHCWG